MSKRIELGEAHTVVLQPKFPVLASSSLRLRPFALPDISRLVSQVTAQRIADMTLAVPRPFDALQARRWIEGHPLEWRRRTSIHWAVSSLDSDWLAGYVGLHDIQLGIGHAKLSFWIFDRLARKYLAIEAASAALAFAFTSLRLKLVQAYQVSGNPQLSPILRRLGMRRSASTLKQVYCNDRNEEVLVWTVSNEGWEASLRGGPTYGLDGLQISTHEMHVSGKSPQASVT